MSRLALKLAIVFSFLPFSLCAQNGPSSNWTHTWGGGGTDTGNGVATDSSGNVYVAGSTTSFGAGGQDVLLVKFGPSGQPLWEKTWGGPSDDVAYGVLADDLGNVYVVGGTDSFGAGWYDALVLKFDSNGDLVWSRTWGGGSYDFGYDLSFDQTGNLTIAAESYSFGNAAVLLKLTTDGALVSATTWKGSATYDSGYSVVVDAKGNSIITGTSWDYSVYPNHNTILLLKFDSSGDLLWSRNWAGPSEDEAFGRKAVRIDAQGNIYVLGHTSPSCATEDFSQCIFDTLLLKTDLNGNLIWARKWGGSGVELPGGLVLNANNYVEAVGSTTSYFGGMQAALGQVYDGNGNLLASKVYKTTAASGWNSLSASNSGTLVGTGFAPNPNGAWQDTGISSVSAPGTLSTANGTVGNPTGIFGVPTGTTSDPTGVLDSGGGGQDILTTAIALGTSDSQTGTISITTNLSGAKFTVTGPKALSGSGASKTFGDVPPGTYTVTFGAVAGYGTPLAQTKTLSAGQEIVFTGTYGPQISEVSSIFPEEYQTITITGTGFGTRAAYTGDSAYIKVSDVSRGWNAGYSGDPGSDKITLIVDSWTDSSIVLGGFAGNYGPGSNSLKSGDQISIQVWNAQTGQGPVTYDVVVATPTASSLLGFPLHGMIPGQNQNLTARSALINSVFDHTMMQSSGHFSIYGCDNQVEDFIGELGDKNPSGTTNSKNTFQIDCRRAYQNAGGSNFLGKKVANYSGRNYLYYDGHPGYDFQSGFGNEVYAATSGIVSYPTSSQLAEEGIYTGGNPDAYNVLELDPGSGYKIFYLHLSTHPRSIAHGPLTASLTGQNFIATKTESTKTLVPGPTASTDSLSISGQVLLDGHGLQGVQINLNSNLGFGAEGSCKPVTATLSTITDVNGNYAFADLPEGRYYNIYVSQTYGYSFAAEYPTIVVAGGASVNSGDLIALSGNAGPCIPAHLHFEVQQKTNSAVTMVIPDSNTQRQLNYVPVDPYGWNPLVLGTNDPYTSIPELQGVGIANVYLWK